MAEEKKTKIDKLNLKSTSFGDGVATNKPLSVGEFENNFVTLANVINTNSEDLNEVIKSSEEKDEELAVIRGRVDSGEARLGELEATGIKMIGLKKELNLNPDPETFDYVNVNYRDADGKKLNIEFLDYEICYEVEVEGTGFNGTWILDETGAEAFPISQSSSETPSTGAIVSLNIPTSIKYANQSVRFQHQAKSVGLGGGLVVDVTFDELGQVVSYTIIETGKDYRVGDVIGTNDPYAGSIELTVSEITKGKTTYTFYMNQEGNYSVKLLNDFDGDGDREWSDPITMTRKYGIFNGQTLSFSKTDEAGVKTDYTLTLVGLNEDSRSIRTRPTAAMSEAASDDDVPAQIESEYDYQLRVQTNEGDFDIRNAQTAFLLSMIGESLAAGDYSMSIIKAGSVIADTDQYIEFDNSGLYIITDIVMTNPTTRISSASGGLFTTSPRNVEAATHAAQTFVNMEERGRDSFISSVVAITNDTAIRNEIASTRADFEVRSMSGLTSLLSSTSYINTQVGGIDANYDGAQLHGDETKNVIVIGDSPKGNISSISRSGGIKLVGNSLVQGGIYFNLRNPEGSEAYCDVYVFGFKIGDAPATPEPQIPGGNIAPPIARS